MGSFDDSFAMSDDAMFSEMGDRMRINGIEIDCVELPLKRDNLPGEGGPQGGLSARFSVQCDDFLRTAGRIGVGVLAEFGKGFCEQGRIVGVTREGGTVTFNVASTSGRKADF